MLLFTLVLLLLPLALPFLEYRADSIVLELLDLFLRDEVWGAQFVNTEGLSSEMTRADENPHMQHDVGATGEFHCSQ